MIGIVIPAHNEEAWLARCLASILEAARDPALGGEVVRTIVVLDDCTDRSAEIATCCGVETLALQARNVGIARGAGAQRLLAAGARWLAFTDADSRVAPDWLAAQLSLAADAVCGSTTGRRIHNRCATTSARPTSTRTAIVMCMAPTLAYLRRRIVGQAVSRRSPAAKMWHWWSSCRRAGHASRGAPRRGS
jgi:glycosyltransferase involved in cell wall biosynthesis